MVAGQPEVNLEREAAMTLEPQVVQPMAPSPLAEPVVLLSYLFGTVSRVMTQPAA